MFEAKICHKTVYLSLQCFFSCLDHNHRPLVNHSIWINPNEFNFAFKCLHPLDTKYNDYKPHFLLHFPRCSSGPKDHAPHLKKKQLIHRCLCSTADRTYPMPVSHK
jgi:hypothetical protein